MLRRPAIHPLCGEIRKNIQLPHVRLLVSVSWGITGFSSVRLERPPYKRCLSWVRIPESGFYSDMLTINIIGEAYSSVQKSVSDFVARVGKVMFSVKQVNPGLVWKRIKGQKDKRKLKMPTSMTFIHQEEVHNF